MSDQTNRVEVVRCLDYLARLLKDCNVPYILGVQLTEDYITSYCHLPEETVSEIRCAAYDLGLDIAYHQED